MGIFEKFRLGFKKSANNFASGLREIIIKKEIDDSTLNKIEKFLISSDVGIDAASDIRDIIAQKKIDPKEDPISEVKKILKEYIIKLLQPLERQKFFKKKENLNVVLVSGVNGVGKTTTIGKIGKIFRENSHSKKELAEKIGTEIAKRSIKNGIKEVAFDKGKYKYHGLIKILAEAAREAGLNF